MRQRRPKTQAAQARALRTLREKTLCGIPLDIADDLIDDAQALRKHAVQDRGVTVASGIGKPWIGVDGGRGRQRRERCLRNGLERRQFWALGFSLPRRKDLGLEARLERCMLRWSGVC